MKMPTTRNSSKARLQSANGPSPDNDVRSNATTAVKKGSYQLRVKTGVKAGLRGLQLNHNASQLMVKSSIKTGSVKTQPNKAQVPGLRVKTGVKGGEGSDESTSGGRPQFRTVFF